MKVLLVLSISPYPKNVGKRIMLGGICDYLKSSERVSSVCIASFAPDEVAGVDHVVSLPRPSSVRKLFNAAWHSMVCKSKSLQESFFWNPAASERLGALIEEFRPDVVLYDTVRTGQYRRGSVDEGLYREVIYMDDLFSIRYDKMLLAMEEHPHTSIDAMGNFGSNVPGVVMELYSRLAPLRRWLLKVERRLIAASEDRVPADFERAFLVSSTERSILMDRADAGNVYVLPPRLDTLTRTLRKWDGRPTFVFLGSLKLAHNTVSIELFLANNMPKILELIPDVEIVLVGAGARPELVELAAQYPGHICLKGFVEDVDDTLSRCCAMIAPLLFGSGVKLKVIDSLRCGTPLISTSVGVEGIELDNRIGVAVVDELSQFPYAMVDLLNPVRNSVAAEANSLLYSKYYSLDAVNHVYGNVLLDEFAYQPEELLRATEAAA